MRAMSGAPDAEESVRSAVPIPDLSGVSLSCQKVCVCRDFLSGPTAHLKAEGCP